MEQNPDAEHRFGGAWTEQKLDILRAYLKSYSIALQKRGFPKVYIDAFAGTGYRSSRAAGSQLSLSLPEMETDEAQGLRDGSARIALLTEPTFDAFLFIDKSPRNVRALRGLEAEFPEKVIQIREGDANEVIQALCMEPWLTRRHVLFLDPFGMQVDWATIEAVAKTRSIDLWLLFPAGIGVNRLLRKSGDIPAEYRAALNRLLGTTDWYEAFYRVEERENLFGELEQSVVKQRLDVIIGYFQDRLKSIFPGVAKNPAILPNSTHSPLYLLCFAVSNPRPRARDLALRLAESILTKFR